MPTSYYQAIPAILDQILVERPRSILDVGVGFGKYGYLCREVLEIAHNRYRPDEWVTTIDGVEGYHLYTNPVYSFAYNHIYYGNITEIVHDLPTYDVVLLIDVLEHFSKDEGTALIQDLLAHTHKALIISTPLFPETKQEYRENVLEQHKSRWHILDFALYDATYQFVPVGDGGAQIVKLYPGQSKCNDFDVSVWSEPSGQVRERLRVTYVLPHLNLTGGLKMLIHQAAELQRRGHFIRIIQRGSEDQAMPKWAEERFADAIAIPYGRRLEPYVKDSDVTVAGWIDQLLDSDVGATPMVYWEQGHEWLFGDSVGQPPWMMRDYLKQCYSRPVALTAVSPIVASILKARYGRIAPIIPNGIDVEAFHPGNEEHPPVVLLVGNPTLRFKGFDVALRALAKVWDAGARFKVLWIAQVTPRVAVPFPLYTVTNPPQHELPEWYREADILLFTSWYEGFAMPPLEAMASGLAVVSTDCGGISSYAIHGENALLAEPGDVDSLATHVLSLLRDKGLRKRLGQKARETATRFRWSEVGTIVERTLSKLVQSAQLVSP